MNNREFIISKVHITGYMGTHPIKKYVCDFKDNKIFVEQEFQQLLLLGIMNEKATYFDINYDKFNDVNINIKKYFSDIIGEFHVSYPNIQSIQYKFEYIYKPCDIPSYKYEIEHSTRLYISENIKGKSTYFVNRKDIKNGFKISIYDRMNRCVYKYENLFHHMYDTIRSLFSHSLDYIIDNIGENKYDIYKEYSMYSKAVINLIEFVSNIEFLIDDELYDSIYNQLKHLIWVARYKRYLCDDKFRWLYFGFLDDPITRTLLYLKVKNRDNLNFNNILKTYGYCNLIILDSK